MITRIQLENGLCVVVQTRATGKVRMTLEHSFVDVSSVDMDPMHALKIAQALLNAGHTAVMVQIQAGAGGQDLPSPQRVINQGKPEACGHSSWVKGHGAPVWTCEGCGKEQIDRPGVDPFGRADTGQVINSQYAGAIAGVRVSGRSDCDCARECEGKTGVFCIEQAGRVNWGLVTMLALCAGVWGCVGMSFSRWCGW